MFYRVYHNAVSKCYVLYPGKYPDHRNPIKKRTMLLGCHILCKRKRVPYMWLTTHYYDRDYYDY